MLSEVLKTSTRKPTQDPRSDRTKEKTTVVYFLKVEQEPNYLAIKIGFASNFDNRLNAHKTTGLGLRPDVSELCVVRATRTEESALKNTFKKHLIPGKTEEFFPAEELVDYVRWLRDQHFVWVPDDDTGVDIAEHESVGAEFWMPRPERRKPRPAQGQLFTDFGKFDLPPRTLTIDDFYTDERIIEAARTALGGIDLDPASHPVANSKVRASRFFNLYDNGLIRDWSGKVWLNPPFSQWSEWAPKIIREMENGRVTAMCVLCATRTLTAQYFSPVKAAAKSICIFNGRIAFWGGNATSSPDDGHAVFYFGEHPERFEESFKSLGSVYHK